MLYDGWYHWCSNICPAAVGDESFICAAFLQFPANSPFTVVDKMAIDAILCHQFFVRAALDDLSLVHHEDLRGMADGFQPVGNHIVTEYYRTLLVQNNFLPAPCPEKFSPAGQCWQVAPAVGCGYNADAASASCRSDPAHGRIYPDPDTDTSAEYGAGVTHASWTARAYRNSTSASCRTSLPTPAGA